MNNVTLMGRLTRDPEVRDGATKIGKLNLAVDRRFKKEGEASADFINCVAFGKTAEFVEKYLHKGTKIALVGHIQTGSYTNKDGNKVYTTDVIIDSLEFAESKNASAQQSGGPAVTPSAPKAPANNDFMTIPDGIGSELPFN